MLPRLPIAGCTLFLLAGCPLDIFAAFGGTTDDPGCEGDADSDTDSDSNTDSDADSDTDVDQTPSFTTAWDASGLTLIITDGSGTYSFGMAEQSENGWYGEDCLPGTGPGSGSYDICHSAVSPTGITLTTVNRPEEVRTNYTTLLNATIAAAGSLAYLLGDNATGACWEQNDGDDYYSCD